MRLIDPAFDLDGFFGRLREASERLLILDYDGTLAPFHKHPERALPYPRVADLLKRASARCSTRVVIVSGRRLADLRGPLSRLPHDEAWGAHGWERLSPRGPLAGCVPASAALRGLMLAEPAARQLAIHGARVERKVASVAVHWRGIPEADAEIVRTRLARAWRGAEGAGLELMAFDGGMELRVRGRDKADAVDDALSACGPDAVCAYLGDDTTDESAFAAMGERGLAVLVRPQLRRTRAHLWLAPPRELTAFLERWCLSACAA